MLPNASPRCWRSIAGWSARWRSCSASSRPAAAAAEVEEVNGVKLAARNLGEVPARDLKGLADAIGKQLGTGVVALVSTAEGKASIVVGVSQDLTGRFNAVELVRAASAAVGGKGGGGRPDMAQAGGPDGAQADAALAAVRRALAEVGNAGTSQPANCVIGACRSLVIPAQGGTQGPPTRCFT